MALIVKTKQGDMLDRICQQYYPNNPGAIKLVIEANPGLTKQPPILPAGIDITLPVLPKPNKQVINIWD